MRHVRIHTAAADEAVAAAAWYEAERRGLGAEFENAISAALDLLEQAGVAITPGIDFGEYRASEHVRFAYTRSVAVLEEGVRRIAAYLGRRV